MSRTTFFISKASLESNSSNLQIKPWGLQDYLFTYYQYQSFLTQPKAFEMKQSNKYKLKRPSFQSIQSKELAQIWTVLKCCYVIPVIAIIHLIIYSLFIYLITIIFLLYYSIHFWFLSLKNTIFSGCTTF